MEMYNFLERLSSNEPTPGGGGVSALSGSLSAALCSMAASLTSGKKKYAQYQSDIERIIDESGKRMKKIFSLIEEDAKAFYPLSQAYSIPKDEPGRDEILEKALMTACGVPVEILSQTYELVPLIEELAEKGSRLAVSDVGVAASACKSAMESAVMNIYINTKLMKNREEAEKINCRTQQILSDGVKRCESVYDYVTEELKK